MATLAFLHAHPDDECILTGVTIAAAVSAGHRVLVAYASRGDAGETNQDLGGESLGERRTREAQAACDELGVARVEWLGFDDSGMAGTPTTENPAAFCNASVDDIASRVAQAFADESVDIFVSYDRNGQYGHPDHVQVHRAGAAVAAALDASWLLEATYHREYLLSLDESPYGDSMAENPELFASSASELTHFVEGAEAFEAKASAISHHNSQVPDDWDEGEPAPERMLGFAAAFGTEWYIAHARRDDAPTLPAMFELASTWSGAPPVPEV